ncbi:FAD/NAD(P)-binding domain-containing protein [Obba rivulosa]|uniref:FAD/NAD(P)-binding domain-containing protein n=1 Tax=Obba rivulosa TaxID=1052685 RepID=A0A8E2AYR0_9APHY|nr:FAD/NAD(P)-binding domain-containing protein [Obba rivulosa]
MAATKVIIAGCGIAGPVLAMFLKLKGYEPVIYERLAEPTTLGLSLSLQPNGLRVLSLIPGLLEKVAGQDLDAFALYSILPEDETLIAWSDQPTTYRELYGHPMKGVRRPAFHHTLVEHAQSQGVKIVWNHQIISLEQRDDQVVVGFADGATDVASFAVGCDGLHGNTRICLFGEENADYTGLTQTGGISPKPDFLTSKGRHPMTDLFGDGAHMIYYEVNDSQVSWALTRREPEAKETWRHIDEHMQEEFKEHGPCASWPFAGKEVAKSAERIVKYGLYDRPELKVWHKGRVALLGDAAHPTSPHLGQGANQAFEDIYHFVRLLVKHNPSAADPSTAILHAAFSEYETIRIPRASALVTGARKRGDNRVVHGVEERKKRNEKIREHWSNEAAVAEEYKQLYTQPFFGQSEI